ncbi:hypothetical protein VC81_12230 [Levilactobacillus spicheri]|uniref:Uncharacterized protein n=1 Tax=Levilactobacillus spicheri TaxID=216463 RepID=A0A0F3RT67_9LACO|nr:hypothetical protein VC81_12230 [Levilactobacillus spicheri]
MKGRFSLSTRSGETAFLNGAAVGWAEEICGRRGAGGHRVKVGRKVVVAVFTAVSGKWVVRAAVG